MVEGALVEPMEVAALVGAMEEAAWEEAALEEAALVVVALVEVAMEEVAMEEALVVDLEEMVAFSLEMKR
jgi:hypothetical protein